MGIGDKCAQRLSTAVMIVAILALSICVLSPMTAMVAASPSGWKENTVDYSVHTWGSSIANDSLGNLYLTYYTDVGVKYATNKDGSWRSQYVDYSQHSQGKGATVLVGPDGYVHLTYFIWDDDSYPEWVEDTIGGGWGMAMGLPISGIDEQSMIASIPIAMNSNGVEMLCYVGAGIHCLIKNGDTWEDQLVDGSGTGRGDIALSNDGIPCLAYPSEGISEGSLSYAVQAGGYWSIVHIGNGNYTEASICLDGTGSPNILAIESVDGMDRLIHYYQSGGIWEQKIMDTSADISGCNIEVRPDGGVAATYLSGSGGVVYAELIEGSWSRSIVKEGNSSGTTGLVYDTQGTPFVSYGESKYATPGALPTFVLFAYVESDRVELYWSYPDGIDLASIDSFELQKGSSPSTLALVGSFDGTRTSYEDSNVVDKTDYYYRVDAMGGGSILSSSTVAHIWFHTDFNSTLSINLGASLHAGLTSPIVTLAGEAMALGPDAREDGIGISLRSSKTLGVSWDEIGTAITTENGSFALDWNLTEEGNYLVEANWQDPESAAHGMKVISIGIASSEDWRSIVVESNSTVLSFEYNDASKNASFEVMGASGSSGYSRICLSKDLVSDPDSILIRIDGAPMSTTVVSDGDYWIVLVEYHHSKHTILASWDVGNEDAAPSSPISDDILFIIALAVIAILVMIATLIYVKRKS